MFVRLCVVVLACLLLPGCGERNTTTAPVVDHDAETHAEPTATPVPGEASAASKLAAQQDAEVQIMVPDYTDPKSVAEAYLRAFWGADASAIRASTVPGSHTDFAIETSRKYITGFRALSDAIRMKFGDDALTISPLRQHDPVRYLEFSLSVLADSPVDTGEDAARIGYPGGPIHMELSLIDDKWLINSQPEPTYAGALYFRLMLPIAERFHALAARLGSDDQAELNTVIKDVEQDLLSGRMLGVIELLFAAFEYNNYEAFYAVSFGAQLRADKIRKEYPEVLWRDKIYDDFENSHRWYMSADRELNVHGSLLPQPNWGLAWFLTEPHKRTILEMRRGQEERDLDSWRMVYPVTAFVSFEYHESHRSPSIPSPRGSRHPDERCKKLIVELRLVQYGDRFYYKYWTIVDGSQEYWP